ncbi:hypothetical protein [Bradyrhizobium sp. 172]|uniref:hypothetical protein n=1 Tax=Bradyrhizobium sp. 172 TaxID=2782643 RepID=UPI001FFF5060|nr:hypothetical protein [Bradyrhizobium sp. 172]UPJ94912.1 hypothetical protein IVB07_31710 [Bradyrhizobium sp. 172]
MEEFMPSHRFAKPEGGFFVGVTLSDPVDPEQLRTQARIAGVDLSDGAGFFLNAQPAPFLRLPFCSMDEDTARCGVRTLATVIERSSPRDQHRGRPSPISRPKQPVRT